MANQDKKVVSPFEYAIMSIADHEKAKDYREETAEEKTKRLTEKFTAFFKRVKVKKQP